MIIRKSDEHLLGIISLLVQDWDTPRFALLYWLRTSCTGQGYATEAAEGVTDFAFDQLDAQRVAISCQVENHRSAAIARRLGFDHEGTLRNNGRNALTGELIDEHYFAKVRS